MNVLWDIRVGTEGRVKIPVEDTTVHVLLGGMDQTVLMTLMNVIPMDDVNMVARVETLLLDHSLEAVSLDGWDMYAILTLTSAHLIHVNMAVHA
jgi:hypothetical protein